jgi:AraC-like DNA-binding protein
VSGIPASTWIESFTANELKHLLNNRQLTLTDIADEMNFSSMSFFSRYVKKVLGVSPSEYRL